MKNTLFVACFCLACISSYAQKQEIPLDKLTAEQLTMYALLEECILMKVKDKEALHLFSYCSVAEDREKISVSTYFYDKEFYNASHYRVTGATYYASLTFNKQEEIQETLLGMADTYNPYPIPKVTNPTYFLFIKEYHNGNKAFPKTLLTKKSESPFFEDSYSGIFFQLSNGYNKIDTLLYKGDFRTVKFVNKDFIVSAVNGKFGVQTKQKDTLIPYECESLDLFGRNLHLLARKDSKYFVIDFKNQPVSDTFDYFISLDALGGANPKLKGKYMVGIDGKQTFIDSSYRQIKPLVYRELSVIHDKPLLLLGKTDSADVLLDFESFEEIIRCDKIVKFDNESFLIRNNNKFGLLNCQGEILLDIVHDTIEILNYDFSTKKSILSVQKRGKYALFKEGHLITEFAFDEIKFIGNYLIVKKNGKYGTINLEGETVAQCKYDSIIFNKYSNSFEATRRKRKYAVSKFGSIY